MFDDLVFIGRFQPFHLAHKRVIDIALTQSQSVILLLGSAQPERTPKNPFLASEREQMIRRAYSEQMQHRLKFGYLIDLYDDKKWVKQVNEQVAALIQADAKVGLIGHFKDDSSYYLSLFPQWELVEVDGFLHELSATPLRDAYWQGNLPNHQYLPQSTQDFLSTFQHSKDYQRLADIYKQQG